jgi:hypothetical protein
MNKDQILTLASILGSKVETRRGNVLIQCPMAPLTHASGTDTHPAFSIKVSETESSVCLCFACGTKGPLVKIFAEANEELRCYDDALKFIEEHDKGGFASALARIRCVRTGGIDPDGPTYFDSDRYVARCMGRVPQYLIDRGIAQGDIERWRIGYDPQMQRAVFPVWDVNGHLVGASRRSVLPREQEPIKYFDTPGLPKERVFYGEHNIDTTRDRVVIVEGILDAIFASRVIPNVVSLMGVNTGIGPERMKKLRNWCSSVTLLLDADQAGHNAWAGWKDKRGKWHKGLRDKLRQYFPVRIARLPEGEDPASVPAATLLEAVNEAFYLGA